jgi:DNA-binding transcriptional LysR family regulator
MELQHLRCAIAIADHGTFTQAAAALHMSQPALSHAIARLEKELGAKLFTRSSAGAHLTAAGEAFVAPARRALLEVTNTHSAVHAVEGVLSGRLGVAGVRTAVVETARLVVEFHARFPGVIIVIEEPSDDRGVIEAVRTGRCDIGIIHAIERPADLLRTPAGEQLLVAIFPEAIAPKGEDVTMEYLSEAPLISPLPGTSARFLHDTLFRDVAQRPREVVAECSDHSTLIELVRGGLGATLFSHSRADAINRDGIVVRAVDPPMQIKLTSIRRPESSPAAEAFHHMLVS